MVRPKKHLGQHFLKDKNIARKIADCLPDNYDTVCEIGPGTGILTNALLKKQQIKKLILIEIDNESAEYLKTHIEDKRITLYKADFLKIDIGQISKKPFALIGNYPYNISSQIFFKALNNRDIIPVISGMIQKEVAERIVAKPGNKTYGILSVLLQTWYDIKYCFTVNENVFFPPPKVKSAVIKLTRNSNKKLDCDEKLYTKMVKTAFNQRRKTLRNSLKKILPDEIKSKNIFDKRPEQLSIAEFIEITKMIEKSANNY